MALGWLVGGGRRRRESDNAAASLRQWTRNLALSAAAS